MLWRTANVSAGAPQYCQGRAVGQRFEREQPALAQRHARQVAGDRVQPGTEAIRLVQLRQAEERL